MHQGRILQVGTPTDVYDAPASRFVAEFVGTSTVMSGTLGSSAGRRIVDLGDGVILQLAHRRCRRAGGRRRRAAGALRH